MGLFNKPQQYTKDELIIIAAMLEFLAGEYPKAFIEEGGIEVLAKTRTHLGL